MKRVFTLCLIGFFCTLPLLAGTLNNLAVVARKKAATPVLLQSGGAQNNAMIFADGTRGTSAIGYLTSGGSYTVDHIKVMVGKNSTPTGTLRARLYSYPGGVETWVESLTGLDVATEIGSLAWRTFYFSPRVVLAADTAYGIGVTTDTQGSGTAYLTYGYNGEGTSSTRYGAPGAWATQDSTSTAVYELWGYVTP